MCEILRSVEVQKDLCCLRIAEQSVDLFQLKKLSQSLQASKALIELIRLKAFFHDLRMRN